MILPTKSLKPEMALLTIGADILVHLQHAMPVSEVWDRVLTSDQRRMPSRTLSFDWFLSALTLLYAISAIGYSNGLLHREASK